MSEVNEAVTVHSLRTEHQTNPLGIDETTPVLSWQLDSTRRGVLQSAYQVLVAHSEADLHSSTSLVWDSGRVESEQSIDVPYAGPGLVSRGRYFWTVRVWTHGPQATGWAKPARWEMGLLSPADWQARWVEPQQWPALRDPGVQFTGFDDLDEFTRGGKNYDRLNPAQLLRRSFTLRGGIERARVYATAHGVYELELNGRRVGDQQLAPEYTVYPEYLMYQTYDVTDLLAEGDNALGAIGSGCCSSLR